MSGPRSIPSLPPLSEADWTRQVTDLARLRGWWAYHTHESRRSEKGWPDWTFVRPPRIVFVELKTETGRVTPEQGDVLHMLQHCPGVEAHLFRPSHFPAVKEVLW